MLELQPFAIEVEFFAARRVPVVDVWLQFTRVDGVYVFWQSSGQWDEGNLRDLEGTAVVRFEFAPNLFGPGDYEVEAVAANGFDLDRNWPHSQVFDRRVGAMRFTVSRERQLVLMGPVNHRFPITVERSGDVDRVPEPSVRELR